MLFHKKPPPAASVGPPPARQAHELHDRKVDRIAHQLRTHRGDRPLSLRKKEVPHQVPKHGDQRRHDDKVELGDLTAILEIDPEARTCTAESGVTFEALVAATLRHGLVPLTVPEFKTITLGGAISGCSIESMSFQHGGFHDSCLSIELITARGEVLHCTPDNENRLLFHMVHGSFGTLGIVAAMTFRLVPAAPYVRVTYEHHTSLEAYNEAIWQRFAQPTVDFMDGIIHSPQHPVLSLGRFVEEAPYTNAYDWTKVYYQSTARRTEDYLRTSDYFFRYNNGVTNVHPKSALGRLVFGKLMDSGTLLWLAERFHRLLPAHDPDVTLDVFVPFSKVGAFFDWYRREIGFFPLWCVPYRMTRPYAWIADGLTAGVTDQLYLDLAIYGMKQPGGRNIYKELEDFLPTVGGLKTLISYNYYNEEDFWKTWNQPNYRAAKQRTDPDNRFRDLYTKTCRASQGLGA